MVSSSKTNGVVVNGNGQYSNGINGSANGHAIPSSQHALIYDKPGSISVRLVELPVPTPGVGEVLINLTHSGVCHSDMAVMTESWGGVATGQVGGHEGVGRIAAFGSDTGRYTLKLGDRVGVKWLHSICHACMPCLTGRDGCCVDAKISGFGTPGTFQQYIVAPASYVTPIPESLPSELAAPILCGGVTVYSALKKSGAQPGESVVISGAGGGLGHLAVQIAARLMGFRVIALDSADKEDLCKECGAEVFFDVAAFSGKGGAKSLATEIKKETSGNMGAAAAVVCVGSNAAYAQSLSFLKFGGTLVCVGVPKSDFQPIGGADPGTMVSKELRIVGSTVGNRKDACEIVEMASRGVVVPAVQVEPMSRLQSVFETMSKGGLQGRVVIDLTRI